MKGFEIKKLDDEGFTLKFYFLEPLRISTGVKPDVLFVQI